MGVAAWAAELRESLRAQLRLFTQSGYFMLTLFSASIAAAFGRFLLAVVFGACALGIGFRLVGRHRASRAAAPRTPTWLRAIALTLVLAEAAALVATTPVIPLLLDQGEGFTFYGCVALIIAALFAAYGAQQWLLMAAWRAFQRTLRRPS